jgi:hypothetical protein
MLEGERVCVSFNDGSRIDDCQLVSMGRGLVRSVWLYDGRDLFFPLHEVTDLWESSCQRTA